MQLTFFDNLRTFFIELFKSFSIADLLILLIGLFFGFVFTVLFYVLFVVSRLKKSDIKEEKSISIDEEKIRSIIISAKNQFSEEISQASTGLKLAALKEISFGLVTDIAGCYYPDSKYPLFELSVEELMNLDKYVIERIDYMFSMKMTRYLRKLSVAQILRMVELKKLATDNKMMKKAKKYQAKTVITVSKTVLNMFNPAYWVRKIMIDAISSSVINKICTTIIEIIGEETNKIYSKRVLNKELEVKEADASINEIENMLDKE